MPRVLQLRFVGCQGYCPTMATCKLQMTIFVILHNELVLFSDPALLGGKSSDGWIMSSLKMRRVD